MPFNLSLTGYSNWFDNFVYSAATGAEEDELPVFQYFQRDARVYGFEAEASARLAQIGGFNIVGDVTADMTRAKIKNAGLDRNVPRIPPLRVLGGLEAQGERVDARVEVEWTDDQNAHRAVRNAHRRLHPGQRLAQLAPASRHEKI